MVYNFYFLGLQLIFMYLFEVNACRWVRLHDTDYKNVNNLILWKNNRFRKKNNLERFHEFFKWV